MEKRNVATEARIKEASDEAIKTAAACINRAQGIMKEAQTSIEQIRIKMESMNKAIEEDEKADKE